MSLREFYGMEMPVCYHQIKRVSFSGPAKEITPDIANLTKLASETQRKFENVESEVKRLRSKNSGMEDEVQFLEFNSNYVCS